MKEEHPAVGGDAFEPLLDRVLGETLAKGKAHPRVGQLLSRLAASYQALGSPDQLTPELLQQWVSAALERFSSASRGNTKAWDAMYASIAQQILEHERSRAKAEQLHLLVRRVTA